ncbi:hypothetical protein [Paraburkholderia nodosa]|uniref:hypothetical protein n=1 Tax=Paraburkholderia nodosa TaxID=392320 RepID=UPI0004887760|nr:hypothetical protein [Paraburkholderia nodosa]
MTGHLVDFTQVQRDALDLLAQTFREHWRTPLEQVHLADCARVSLALFDATSMVIHDDALRLELARRTYTVLMHDGGGIRPASEEPVALRAYHDPGAQKRWSHEVILWLGDLIGHLQDEATRSGAVQ